jgi:LysR family transcriptional regulator, low CO2-responsive transcriptional regulator
MFSIHQLRTFLEVARAGSVQEAADSLIVSQPAVSSALAGLQRELGLALIERRGRGIGITAAGREVEREGRRVVALLAEIEKRARSASSHGGRLRLATVTTVAEHLLATLLAGVRSADPHIEIELEVANRQRVWDRLAHWEVDLALAGRPPQDRDFLTLATRPNELVVVGASEIARHLSGLGETTWLVREAGSGTRVATEELFATLDIAPPRLTIGSNNAIRECLRVGLGISLLSRDAVVRELQDGTLIVVPTRATPIARPWHLVAGGDREVSATALSFVEYAVTTSSFVLPRSGQRRDRAG